MQTAYKPTVGTPGGEQWYYINAGKKCGPVDGNALRAKLSSGELPDNTKVWKPGMENWTPAGDAGLVQASRPKVVSYLDTEEEEQEDAQPKKKSRWWIWLIIAVVAVAAIVCCILFIPGGEANVKSKAAVKYELADLLVFENEECAFYVDAIGEKGDYLELDVRCINKTGDTLSFRMDNTSINSSMFDPMWAVQVTANATMESSVTFPLGTLKNHNLLPAEELCFILQVYNESQAAALLRESARFITAVADLPEDALTEDYKKIDGYEDYLFAKSVKVDTQGRPYYEREDATQVYFDEIYDRHGVVVYAADEVNSLYNDPFGRPYYVSDSAGDGSYTFYYEGYGFAFYDEAADKYYFYDETGRAANYSNGGVPEYYEGEITEEMRNTAMPASLAKACGSYVVHKEFALYPTGEDADDVERPQRVSASSEVVYWAGEKGSFVVLGGEMDTHTGYIVHTYIENNSDSYMLLAWDNVMVNGIAANPDSLTILRPHSSTYADVVIPAEFLKTNKIKEVERIDFQAYTMGENLYVPLYPIQWTATDIAKK